MLTSDRQSPGIGGDQFANGLGAQTGSASKMSIQQARSQPMIVLGMLLVLGSALAGALLFWLQGQRQEIVVSRSDFEAGQEVSLEDFAFESVDIDAGLDVVTRFEIEQVFSAGPARRFVADRPIRAGSFLAEGDVASQTDQATTSLLGVVLAPGAYPTSDLAVGTIVDVIGLGADTGSSGDRIVTQGRVELVEFAGSSDLFVTLEIPTGAAVRVAALADDDRIRLAIPLGGG